MKLTKYEINEDKKDLIVIASLKKEKDNFYWPPMMDDDDVYNQGKAEWTMFVWLWISTQAWTSDALLKGRFLIEIHEEGKQT